MALLPISVQLSTYENIEILRQEIETRQNELKEIEKQIRAVLWEMERQKYLKSLHHLFDELEAPQDVQQLGTLQSRREALDAALLTMRTALKDLESSTEKGDTGEQSKAVAPQGQRARFESFEQFRKQRST